MNQFDRTYNRIIQQNNLVVEGLFGFSKNRIDPSDMSAICRKLWNDKNYNKLADKIKEYKQDKHFDNDPQAQFYYGMLLLKDLINENKLILLTKQLLLESVVTDKKEENIVQQISKKEFKQTKRKAFFGNGDALYDLAIYYYVGIPDVVEKDVQKSIEYFKKAAKKKVPEALYNLAVMYQNGDQDQFKDYIEKDEDKAFLLYKKAFENGYEEALEPYKYLLNKKKYEKAVGSNDIIKRNTTTNQAKKEKGLKCLYNAAQNGCKEAKIILNTYFKDFTNQLDLSMQTQAAYAHNVNLTR